MTSDLEQRLHNYRATLDDAIADDLAGRNAPRTPRSAMRRSLVGVAAVAIVAVGLGALAWTAANSSDSPEQSTAPATTTLLATGPSITDAPTASTAPDNTETGVATPVGSERLALGSSVMLGAASELVDAGFVVDAMESRQFSDIVDITASLASNDMLGDVVVIHAGTNGSIQADDLDAVASNLAEVANVYVLTDAIDRPWVEPNNELLRSLADSNPNVTVIDWATASSSCPGDCFMPDNLHLRPDGRRYYADLIHEATSEPASWTLEPDALDPSAIRFTVAVTRTGCSGGHTGTVYPPTVDIGATDIVVTFRVEPLDPRFDYPCPSNDTVQATVTLPEPIGQRQLVDGTCTETEGAACASGPVRWNPSPATPISETSDTILSPPLPVAEPVVVSLADMEAIRNSFADRRTVALERSDVGTVLWWMTVWSGTTPSGVDVYCTGTSTGNQGGATCVPDANVELRNPVQVDGYSTEAPSVLMLITESDVTSLRASIDQAPPIPIEAVDVGVPSGKKVAGLYLGEAKSTVRFDATLSDGSTYTFEINAPNVTTSPSTDSSGSDSLLQPYAPKELLGE